MIYNLQAQSGFRRDSMWCGPAAHAVMPSPAERNERGACTSFGRVLKAADITSVRLGSAQCGIAQPCLTLSANASAFLHAQHGPESTGFAHGTPWECGAILFGQRSNTDERHIGRQRFGLSLRTVGATSRSGGIHGLSARMELKSMSHWSRNFGNPCAEKVSAHRSRQSF
jgi:hypothetical protein